MHQNHSSYVDGNERYKQIQESIDLSSVPVSCNREYKNISLILIDLVGIYFLGELHWRRTKIHSAVHAAIRDNNNIIRDIFKNGY